MILRQEFKKANSMLKS